MEGHGYDFTMWSRMPLGHACTVYHHLGTNDALGTGVFNYFVHTNEEVNLNLLQPEKYCQGLISTYGFWDANYHLASTGDGVLTVCYWIYYFDYYYIFHIFKLFTNLVPVLSFNIDILTVFILTVK